MTRSWLVPVLAAAACLAPGAAVAQTFAQRGFVDLKSALFPQDAPHDGRNLIVDLFVREEVFAKPAPWVQFAAGFEGRINSYDQVEESWRVAFRDRTVLRPALTVRRLSATLTRGGVTVDAGKQFLRWGKTDIVTPTDRFAPRDFLNVIDSEFLPVTGVRLVVQRGADAFEAAWVPYLTPSRTPLLDQRWTVRPESAGPLVLRDATAGPPDGAQLGVRWSHTGAGYEFAASYYDGFNHLPVLESRPGPTPSTLDVLKVFPEIRSYGLDAAVPTRWFTIKGEAAWFTTTTARADEYLLYVLQIERQTGEWSLVGGYAGEAVTARRSPQTFAPDRGLTRSLVGRASYTIDANRSVTVESAVRQNGDAAYGKFEYSQARGAHWRTTFTATAIGGRAGDFLGQYRRNSHLTLAVRYSF